MAPKLRNWPTFSLWICLVGCGSGGSIGPSKDAGATGGGGGGAPTGEGGSDGGRDQASIDEGEGDTAPVDVTVAGQDAMDVYMVDRPTDAPGILIHVANGCPFDLWIHGEGTGAVLMPDAVQLKTGATQDYVAPEAWPSARVTAYLDAPLKDLADKVEMTLEKKLDLGELKKVINYNITYVDWLALPMEMLAFGTGDDCKQVGCYVPESQVLAGCPDGLLSGKRCLSAGNFCADPTNQANAYCHMVDPKIAQCAQDAQKYPLCAGAAGSTTPQVFGCSGAFFSQSPKWCAALNRGMLEDPDNGDISLYYKNEPFNTYAKWVHGVCPGIYAFPYDDYGKTNESGFHSCTGGTQLNITFCPAG
ncbi:MAG TPA: beta-1,3-glucanase family protein [Polyangia bacterium]|nr:beta-1,3-glucanase family protein [Polyangia bacterium]